MNYSQLFLETIFFAITGYLLCKFLIRYSIKHSLVDLANSRSSHKVPTPRIGGISFAVLISIILLTSYGFTLYELEDNIYLALLIPSMFVALVSLADDIKGGISRWIRLLCHLLAMAIASYLILMPPTIETATLCLLMIMTFCGAWFINLYNFMDGIDGIAASEAIFIIAASSGFALLNNHNHWAYLQISLLGPLFGFLLLNWQPAKIFMGDIGSTFLGALLGCILAISVSMGSMPIWSGIILAGTFLSDATWTLGYRVITGQKWYHPHRSHNYQILSRKMNSHAKTSLAYLAVNIGWLWPLAYCACILPDYGKIFAVIALLPLLIVCMINGAGKLSSNR